MYQCISATGTRTRVARVRAEYPSQLDYGGCGWPRSTCLKEFFASITQQCYHKHTLHAAVTPAGSKGRHACGWQHQRSILRTTACYSALWCCGQRESGAGPTEGLVAQWIRHRPTEPGIAGSSPAEVIGVWECGLLLFSRLLFLMQALTSFLARHNV